MKRNMLFRSGLAMLLSLVLLLSAGAGLGENVPWEYALDSILCIGDSLTRGITPQKDNMPPHLKQNYPYYLSRLLNTDVENAGIWGINTRKWYAEYYDKYQMENYNAFIIFLGTNGGLTDTLAEDVQPYSSFGEYADTHTGCYCKLIEHLQADRPDGIIVLVNVYRVGKKGEETRETIRKIGEKYGLPVVETEDLAYKNHPEYHGGYNNVHMTKAGYLALASKICETLRSYYAEHVSQVNGGMSRK